MSDTTTIQVRKETKELLDKIKVTETYDDVILKLALKALKDRSDVK